MKDLQDIVHELKGKGVALKATEQPIDTATAAGKSFLDMLGVFAEFETNETTNTPSATVDNPWAASASHRPNGPDNEGRSTPRSGQSMACARASAALAGTGG